MNEWMGWFYIKSVIICVFYCVVKSVEVTSKFYANLIMATGFNSIDLRTIALDGGSFYPGAVLFILRAEDKTCTLHRFD